MKSYIPYSILLAAASCGMAFGAATAYSGAVGYETLALNPGFNFVGVRLQESPIAAGTLESFTAGPNRVTDDQIDLGALITGGKTYILEIQDGSGIIQEVTTVTGTSLNVAANLSGLSYPVSYSLRAASTLTSLFGDTPTTMKIDIGQGSVVGADQLWFFNGTGFTKVYYDKFGGVDEVAGWYNVDTNASVSGGTNVIYADGFIIASNAGKDVTVSGDLKAGNTELNLASGFNVVSPVAPVGVTLDVAFGHTAVAVEATGLNIGQGTVVGADQLWFFNGTGFDKIYFDKFGGVDEIEGWYNVDTNAVVSASTVIPPGYILAAAAAGNVVSGVPSYYTGL